MPRLFAPPPGNYSFECPVQPAARRSGTIAAVRPDSAPRVNP